VAEISVYYFSDVLCVWAYAAQARLNEVQKNFAGRIDVDMRFCWVFADAREKIRHSWRHKGGFEGFNAHLTDVAARFPDVTLHEGLWLDVQPYTSTAAHLFLKALHLEAQAQSGDAALFADAIWRTREAFFRHGKDISNWQVHEEIAEALGMDFGKVAARIRSGEAVAALDADRKLGEALGVEASPTFVMNEGRQKLSGNVGYRLIEANLEELLRKPKADEASWC
jgi:predicted DsbA family dithiol-disulfide isomerase